MQGAEPRRTGIAERLARPRGVPSRIRLMPSAKRPGAAMCMAATSPRVSADACASHGAAMSVARGALGLGEWRCRPTSLATCKTHPWCHI
jgi:hypothetical protein